MTRSSAGHTTPHTPRTGFPVRKSESCPLEDPARGRREQPPSLDVRGQGGMPDTQRSPVGLWAGPAVPSEGCGLHPSSAAPRPGELVPAERTGGGTQPPRPPQGTRDQHS